MRSVARFASTVVLCMLVLVGSAAAQQTTAAPTRQPAFLDSLPVDCTTFFYVNDLVPHLEAALSSAKVSAIFEGKTLAAASVLPTPQEALAQLRAFQGFIPEELAAGLPPSAYVQFVKVCRTGLYASLAVGARLGNETENIAGLQNRIISEVRNLRVPRVVVYAKFRDEAVPMQLMGLAASLVPPDTGSPGTEEYDRGGGYLEEAPVEQRRLEQPNPYGAPPEEPPVEDPRAVERGFEEPPAEDPRAVDPRAIDARAGERGMEEPPLEDPRTIDLRAEGQRMEGVPLEGAESGGFSLPAFAPTDSKVVSLDIAVSDYIPVEAIAPALQQFGGFDEERGKALAEAICDLGLQATLTREETAVQLIIGPGADRKVRPLKSKPLASLWKPGPEVLYYAQWDIGALRKPWEALYAEWLKWESTPAGEALKKLDSEGLPQYLTRSQAALQKMATRGAVRATAAGRVLDITIHEQEFPSSPALIDVPVTNLFPKAATTMVADSTQSLSDVISEYFAGVENRLPRQAVQPDAQTAAATDASRPRLQRFRNLIHDQSRTMFVPPIGVLTATGKLEGVSLSIGDAAPIEIGARAVTEFALIGRLAPGNTAGKKFYADAYQALLNIADQPVAGEVVEERDLGLGVPAMVFLPVFAEALPAKINVTASGDLLPHYFVLNDWLVLSTSPRLSQAIVAAAANDPKEVKLPNLKNKLVTLGWMSGAATAQLVNDLETVVELMDPAAPQGASSGQVAFSQAIDLVRECALLMNNVKWYTTETNDTRVTDYRVVWQK